jgi:hypothetical protein
MLTADGAWVKVEGGGYVMIEDNMKPLDAPPDKKFGPLIAEVV